MRKYCFFAIFAALALGASFASLDQAPTRHVLQMAPPEDSSARSFTPNDDDLKLETGTAAAPKTDWVVVLSGKLMELLAAPASERSPETPIPSK